MTIRLLSKCLTVAVLSAKVLGWTVGISQALASRGQAVLPSSAIVSSDREFDQLTELNHTPLDRV